MLWATKSDIRKLEKQIALMAATLDSILAKVTDEETLEDSLIALVGGLKQQLADALSGTTLPAATQAKVDAIFTAVEAQSQKMTDAITANTPAA
jgi:hypothetical protein